jgi:proteasome accessory factor C
MTAEPENTPAPPDAASQRKAVAKADEGVAAEPATRAKAARTVKAAADAKARTKAKAGTKAKAVAKAKAATKPKAVAKAKPAVAAKPAGEAVAAGAARAAVTATATERLQRLLALVPYVISRNVVGMAETAAAFGVTERELVDDLNLLWCVELRSPDPYCPIDLSYEGGEIVVSEAEAFGRPLRLGVDEASALLIALRMLTALPAVADGTALSRTIAKLEAVAGAAADPAAKVAVQVNVQAAAAQVAEALRRNRRLHLRHYVPGRDEPTERDVDPMRLLVVDGRDYLEGWCRRAEDVRLFRLDRVLAIEVLDVPKEVPAGVEQIDVDRGLFRPSPQDIEVEFELSSAGHWVAEYYPCEEVEELGDGRLRIRLRTPDTQLVRRLALRLGEDGRLLAPADLVEQVAADATAALENYA